MTVDMREPTKIMFMGDVHGNGEWVEKAIHHARRQGVDVIVQVGDFGWWVDNQFTSRFLRYVQTCLEKCNITLYWVDGNHEDHSRVDEWVDATGGRPWSDKRYPRIIHLPRGFRWSWWGRDWLALGGAHSVDRHVRVEGESWWDREHISTAEANAAIAGGKADVMITHDCPIGVIIPGVDDEPKFSFPEEQLEAAAKHRTVLRGVVDVVRPVLLVHGHYHVRYGSLLRYPDGGATVIAGLDCDATSLDENTMVMERS